MADTSHIMTESPEHNLIQSPCPVPLGVSLAYVVVVDYSKMFPKVAYHLQLVCNDGAHITLIP